MKAINVRVFRVVFWNGDLGFESKIGSTESVSGSRSSIQALAKDVKNIVERFLRENYGYGVKASIDFQPHHDIECPVGLEPRRCLPLSEIEADEFWRVFTS